MLEQISQLQQHIHRIEEEIEKQIPFEASAERLMAVRGIGTSVGGPCGMPRCGHPMVRVIPQGLAG